MNETALRTEELTIEGLHCTDCAATIEKTVCKMEGVKEAAANFTTGRLKVSYNPLRVKITDLITNIEKIGYRTSRESHTNLERPPIWRELEFLLMLASGFFLGLGLLFTFSGFTPPLFEGPEHPLTLATVFYLLATLAGAYQFGKEAWASVKNFQLNISLLMTIAIIGAIIIGEYVEAASLAFLFSLAELLEGHAVERARDSLRELIKLTPEKATVKKGSQEVQLNVSEVRVGETLLIRPGEKIPLDGEIIKGSTSVDQSPITGESLPISKSEGEQVYAGSLNNEGFLEVRVTQNSKNTMLAKIIHLIEDAESKKAPIEKFVQKFAKIYTPTIVALAVGIAFIPPLFLGSELNVWVIKALTLLVIACPCALVISTPVSVVSALTSASRNGVLIKGGVYLEEMSKIKVLAFDKTGTLTAGELAVTDIVPLDGIDKSQLLGIAASLEKGSEHPIAKAINRSAHNSNSLKVKNFKAIPGLGVEGKIESETYKLGRPALFENSEKNSYPNVLSGFQQQGKTTMLVGTNSKILGVIALSDQVRPDAIKTVAALKKADVKVVMLTGDNQMTAQAIAQQLNVTEFHAELLPEQKVEKINELTEKYGKTAMVGDGINDAPALAASSVGIAMGVAGTDTALETADIALMSDNLTKLPYLFELSKKANAVIKQNTFASILIKFSLAIGVFPGMVSLVVAVLVGDMGASLGVTANAMRLARFKSKGIA